MSAPPEEEGLQQPPEEEGLQQPPEEEGLQRPQDAEGLLLWEGRPIQASVSSSAWISFVSAQVKLSMS